MPSREDKLTLATGALVAKPGGFDPETDVDVTGASEKGDPFYIVAPRVEPGRAGRMIPGPKE